MRAHTPNQIANHAYELVGRALARDDYARVLQRLEDRHAGLESLYARNLSDARRHPGNSECAVPWLNERDVLERRRQGYALIQAGAEDPAKLKNGARSSKS